MIVDRWGVKDHCVDCGLPCIRTTCPHYAAGATVRCDVCGDEWDVPLNSPEMGEDCGDVHLCDRCEANGGKAMNAQAHQTPERSVGGMVPPVVGNSGSEETR